MFNNIYGILSKLYWDFEQFSRKLWKFLSSLKIFWYILDDVIFHKSLKNFSNCYNLKFFYKTVSSLKMLFYCYITGFSNPNRSNLVYNAIANSNNRENRNSQVFPLFSGLNEKDNKVKGQIKVKLCGQYESLAQNEN